MKVLNLLGEWLVIVGDNGPIVLKPLELYDEQSWDDVLTKVPGLGVKAVREVIRELHVRDRETGEQVELCEFIRKSNTKVVIVSESDAFLTRVYLKLNQLGDVKVLYPHQDWFFDVSVEDEWILVVGRLIEVA